MSIESSRPGSPSLERDQHAQSLEEPVVREVTPPSADEEIPRQTPSVHRGNRGEREVNEGTPSPGGRTHGTRGATPGQNLPERPHTPEALASARRWQKETEERIELASLLELRRRYEQGDPGALLSLQRSSSTPFKPQSSSSAGLPRPEPPQTYAKHNRAQFNRWERDCEGFFLRSPSNFLTEEQKVDFAARYLSESLKTLWQSHVTTNRRENPLWIPTWQSLKTMMLDALGTPAERQQAAYEAIKRCRQGPKQSPTDLLDHLRPLWEELGSSHGTELQVLGFVAALSPNIQRDLLMVPVERRDTIPKVEEQANMINRRLTQHASALHEKTHEQNPTPKKGKGKHRATESGSEGNQKPPKKSFKSKEGRKEPYKGKKGRKDAGDSSISCWECGETTHIRPDCPKLKDKGKGQTSDKPGKDKGQKT